MSMPPDPPRLLPPVSQAAATLESFRKRPLAIIGFFLAGLVLIVMGQFKPLAAYFFAAFPWVLTILGALLCVSTLASLFEWREIMIKSDEKKLAYGFGVVFVVVLLIIAIFYPNPTEFQYTVFRIVLALAAAGVAAMFSGFLEVTVNKWIRAGGALAVFAIVYFYAPAALSKLH
jgi:hypothetical protein